MDDLESLLDNEREWRRYLIDQVAEIKGEFTQVSKEIAAIKVWNMVFRIVGGGFFGLMLVWFEYKLNS